MNKQRLTASQIWGLDIVTNLFSSTTLFKRAVQLIHSQLQQQRGCHERNNADAVQRNYFRPQYVFQTAFEARRPHGGRLARGAGGA